MHEKSGGIRLGRLAALLSAVYLILFLIFYIPNFATDGEWARSDLAVYTVAFLTDPVTELIEAAAFTLLVTLLSSRLCRGANTARTLLGCLLLSLPLLVYRLPYYYLDMLSEGYDSLEATLISLGICFGLTAFSTIKSFLCVLLFRCVLLHFGRSRLLSAMPEKQARAYRDGDKAKKNELRERALPLLPEFIRDPGGALDLSSAAVAAVFSVSFLEFLYRIILRIADVAVFFTEIGGAFLAEDIIYITACFILSLCSLIASQVISVAALKRAARREEALKSITADAIGEK